jgi:hypothetical protein
MGHIDDQKRRHLALETREMIDIDNYQSDQLTRLDWRNAADTESRFRHRHADFVGSPSPLYNCHGLTFAARRTQVDGSNETIRFILEEDGYVPLTKGEKPRPSDVVVYYDDRGEVLHSGIIVSISESLGLSTVPRVWSKWGKCHEVIHALSDCPYDSNNVLFYRMKPWEPKHR